MFEASEPFGLFDLLRVPYAVVPASATPSPAIATLTPLGGRSCPQLGWPTSSPALRSALPPARYEVEGIPFFASLVADATVAGWLSGTGLQWTRELPITDLAGAVSGSLWRGSDGSVFVPFDPWEALESYLSERYLGVGRAPAGEALQRVMRRTYYRTRPLLPRGAQIALRRRFSQRQSRVGFPRWPLEPAFDDLVNLVVRLVTSLVPEPVPMIGTWPTPYSWALVLTHDVETRVGYENVHHICELERRAGFRSSWNLVPERDYAVDESLLTSLDRDGFEIGVHGLRHDGRDFDSRRHLRRRLPAIHDYARRWHAVGFRSPSTLRRWEWMQLLEFDYDSSYTDTAPYESQAGGCCTWLPYTIGVLVELPITLPQDHTLFEILECRDETVWVEKARLLRARGGMALMLTHPDYMIDTVALTSYERFLEQFAEDDSAWKALPREVASWWRRRAASRLERVDGHWIIRGPAATDGAVVYLGEEEVWPGSSLGPRPEAAPGIRAG